MKNYPDVGKKLIAALPVIAIVLSIAALVTAVGPCTTLGTRTTVLGLCKPAQGEVNWDQAINGNFDTIDALFQSGGFLRPQNGGFGFNVSAAANGQLPIGNGTGFTLAPLTAGPGILITPSVGGIQIASSGSPAGGSIFAADDMVGSGNGTDYSTTSATFVDVDASNLKASITVPVGSKFLIAQGSFCAGSSIITDSLQRVRIFGAGGAGGRSAWTNNGIINPVGRNVVYAVIPNPASGAQTVALQYRGDGVNSFTITNQHDEGTLAGPIPVCRARMMYIVTN